MTQEETNNPLRPSVSVVIPVYNVAPYVERCIWSVIKQTYPAKECIIVDDASTDDSITRCKRLIDGYKGATHFVYLHHELNRGLAAARNTGTDAATGNYIFYLDSDDELTPDCLEKLSNQIRCDDSIEMVMGESKIDFSAMTGLKYRLKQWKSSSSTHFMRDTPSEMINNEEIRRWYYQGNTPRSFSVWNKLLKLSFVKENHLYNKEGLKWEDTMWTYYLMRCINHVVIVHDVTYIYHIRPNSITVGAEKGEKDRHFGYIYREMAEHIVPGERIEETVCWHKQFCRQYIEAWDNPNYQFAYGSFLRQLSEGKHQLAVWRLKAVHIMAQYRLGRIVYKSVMKAWILLHKIGRFIS